MLSTVVTGSAERPKPGRFSVIRFRVSDYYSEDEIEQLFNTLVERGATYKQVIYGSAWHELSVPVEFDWEPYFQTLKACASIVKVNSFITKRQIIPLGIED